MSFTYEIPPVGTIGPDYAEKVNEALQQLKDHEHTGINGDASKITQDSITIDGELELNNNSLTESKSVEFNNQTAITESSAIWTDINGDLWYNNGNGVPVQITLNNNLNVLVENPNSYGTTTFNTNTSILSGDTFTYIFVTSTPINITLPTAATAGEGRYFYIKDVLGTSYANPIVLLTSGMDEIFNDDTAILKSNYGCWKVVSDGIDRWNVDLSFGLIDSNVLLGNSSGSASQPLNITLDTTLGFSGTTLRRSALTGDVTSSAGSNTLTIANDAVTTAKILNDAVTYAKIQNVTSDRLLGRDTSGSGDAEEISLNSTLEFTGTGAIQRAALTGDVTSNAGSNSTTIANDAVTTTKILNDSITTAKILNSNVTFAKIQNIPTDSLIGRDAVSSGVATSITLGTGIEFTGSNSIQRSALTGDVTASAGSNTTTIANNAVTTAKILDNNVTLAKFQQIATDSLLGRDSSGTGNIEVISLDSTLSLFGGSLGRQGISGDITIGAGSNTASIAPGVIVNADVNASAAISYSKLANASGYTVLGNATSSTAAVAEIVVDQKSLTLGSSQLSVNVFNYMNQIMEHYARADFVTDGPFRWLDYNSGSYNYNGNGIAASNVLGSVIINSNGVSGSGGSLTTASTVRLPFNTTFVCKFRTSANTTQATRMGFFANPGSTSATDIGMYFQVTTSGTTCLYRTYNGSSFTDNMIALTAATWYTCIITTDSTNSSSTCYIYNNDGTLHDTATATSAFPTQSTELYCGAYAVGSNSGAMVEIDYISINL